MTNSEQTPGYDTWIANLMAGTESAEDQAARAAFRAMQARKPAPAPQVPADVSVTTTGRNTWAMETGHGDDALTTFTLLDGPGRFANCTQGR